MVRWTFWCYHGARRCCKRTMGQRLFALVPALSLLAMLSCKDESKKELQFDPPAPVVQAKADVVVAQDLQNGTVIHDVKRQEAPARQALSTVEPDTSTHEVSAVELTHQPPPIRIIEYPNGRFRFWTWVERFGVPQGVRRIDEGVQPRREHVQIVVVGSRVIQLHHLDLTGRPNQTRDDEYGPDGRIRRFVVTNKMGKTVSVGQYEEGLDLFSWRETTGMSLLHGCHKVRYEYDDEGYVASRSCVGPENAVMEDLDGVYKRQFEVDLLGRTTQELYFDVHGYPCADIFEVHGRAFELNLDGLIRGITHVDFKGNPALHAGLGVARLERDLNRKGQLESETFLGRAGEPMADVRSVYGIHYQHAPRGFRTEQAFVDDTGKPMREKNSGIAIIQSSYSDSGCLTSRQFFSAPRKAGVVHGRVHTERFECNPMGDIVAQSFMGPDYMETSDSAGVHRYLYEYSPEGLLAAKSCWSASGKGIAPKKGLPVHRRIFTHDYRLRLEEELFQGHGGKGAALWGMARGIRYRYDAWGQPISLQFVGQDSKPVQAKLGFSEERREYDALGRLVRSAVFDLKGEPATIRKGTVTEVHRREWVYGRGPAPVKLSFYGPESQLVRARLSGKRFKGNVYTVEFVSEGIRIVREKMYTDLSNMPARVLQCDKGQCYDPFEIAPGR